MTSGLPSAQKSLETNWSTSSVRKTQTASSTSDSPGLARVWQSVINAFAPIGYEDETGFHYGERTEGVD